MVKRFIVTIALFAALSAQADYLFVNATGNLLPGYTVEIKSSNGRSLKVLENGKSAYVKNDSSYELIASNPEHEKGNPLNFTPRKSDINNVIVVKFGKVLDRIKVNQTTLEKAKRQYGNRIEFPG